MWQRKVKWGIFLVMLFGFWLSSEVLTQAAPLTAMTTRLYGPTRIETAIRISQEGWTNAPTVLLARADDFPDSLVSVPLSRRLDAPILLTYPNQVEEAVLLELKRLGTKHVIILGGAAVMGEKITTSLEQEKLTWERIGGVDRYDTAVQVAQRLGGNGQVILTSGENFPDALAIGPYAGQTETPILLTTSKVLPQITKDTLESFGAYTVDNGGEAVAKTYVIGGEGVVTPKVVSGLSGMKRIYGKDRYETAARVFWFTQEQFGALNDTTSTSSTSKIQEIDSSTSTDDTSTGNETVIPEIPIVPKNNGVQKSFLVTGENFPDALVAGALAVKQNAYLFMSATTELPVMTYSAMGNAGEKLWAVLVGGEAILSERVQSMVEGTIIPPYLLAGLTIVIDPGHGGKDPGAIGSTGTNEKNNTLPVGLYLAELLRQAGAKVILTRTNDSSPAGSSYTQLKDLQARVEIANQNKADLYVSIHNDSFSNPEAGGTTTYISLDNPQADKAKRLANAVQQEVVRQVNLQNRNVKSANFYVIKNTTMPSILVELGFISNPTEEKLLASNDFQKKAATGIYRGILIYQGF